MRHISKTVQVTEGVARLETQCSGVLQPGDEYVKAAMDSDCDDCRVRVGIARTTDRGCAPKEPMTPYEPEPHADAETALADAVRRRDGR